MSTEKIRLMFFGTPAFGAKLLAALFDAGFEISAVVTQPTKKGGRGNRPVASKVKEFADSKNLLVYQPTSQSEIIGITKRINPDLVVTGAYGKILPNEVLNIPRFGAINVHGSLLPKYRGASPIPAAILNGDKKTGVTIMKMTDQLDSGPIISQAEINLTQEETTGTLYESLAIIGAEELVRIIPLYIDQVLHPKDQDHNKATYCSAIRKQDGLINWHRSAVDIERTVRAFIPWPHSYTYLDDKLLIILEAKPVEKALEPGYIVVLPNSFLVGCGTDSLEVTKLQLEGKNPVDARDFIHGYRNLDGKTLQKKS